ILTGFGQEERFVDRLLQALEPQRADAREFAIQRRVLLARTKQGISVDIALGAFPFEARSMQHSSDWEFATGQTLRTCSGEDLLIHKVFAGRDRDWADVETILLRQKGLDLHVVRRELNDLLDLKGEMESLDKLERMIQTVKRRTASP